MVSTMALGVLHSLKRPHHSQPKQPLHTAAAAVPQRRFDCIGRLRKRFEFVCVQRRGLRCCTASLIFIAKKCRNCEQGRVGFTTPKKIGPAHVRNRIKRRLRHLASYYQETFVGYDVVILALPQAVQRSFVQLHQDFQRALQLMLLRRQRQTAQKGQRRRV
ncbi:MAG: ribonuclease P protein component [Myxococcota bacterium]